MLRRVPCLFLLVAISSVIQAQTQETMADNSFGVKGDVIISDANRSPDTSFNLGGRLALQGNKIIVSGGITSDALHVKFPDRKKVFRLNSDGSLDSSFGDKGFFSYTFPEKWSEGAYRVQCQSTGKIVCVVNASNGKIIGYKSYYGLVRLNANGSLDTTFGDSGYYATGAGTEDMVILPNDEIVLASIRGIKGKLGYKIVKYGKNGGMVASDSIQFEKPYFLSFNSQLRMRLTDDNKIVLGGDQYFRGLNNLLFSTFRYDFSLHRETDYGAGGHFSYIITKDNGYFGLYQFAGMATQKNGKVVGAYLNSDTLKMISVDATGKLNKNFGINGVSNYNYDVRLHYIDNYAGLESQNDDKLLFAPLLNTRGIHLTRFNADGYIDSSFGDGGISFKHVFVRGHQMRVTPFQILVQPDNKILLSSDGEFIEFDDFEGAAVISRYLSEKSSGKIIAKTLKYAALQNNKAIISISPNPVKDILNIYSSNLSCKNLTVINASGKVVLKTSFTGKQHAINASSLAAGIYYVRIIETNGGNQLVKILKQ